MHRRSPALLLAPVSSLVTALVAALALAVVPAAPAAAAGVHYVALGDSYSAGVGTDDTSGTCQRSSHAYPALYTAATHPTTSSFVACSGATTSDVRSSQLSALSTATTLVSITVGGNDVGFSSVMRTCVLHSTDDCVAAVDGAEDQARTSLPGVLDRLYADIHSRAPSARVVVLGYPVFYDLSATPCYGLSDTDHRKIDEGVGVLDSVVKSAAGRAGYVFADVRSAFVGHQICDGGTKWLHALNYSDIDESYHPNTDGHARAYEPVFAAAA